MTKYEVTAVSARLSGGVLGLTKEQAAPRLHNLKALPGGKYEIVRPVEFKRGEVIGYDGDLPKVLASALADVDAKSGKGKGKAKGNEVKAEAEAPAESQANEALPE
jgi:hypothetical protein